jgi:CRP-like cAMP-binding protein
MAALIEAPRTASVLATEDSNVAVISGDTFRNLLRESGEVSLFMLKEFSNRLKQANKSLEELTQSSIRLTVLLYFFAEWPLPDDQNPLEDLCRYTRKEPGEIQQVLKVLSDQNIIAIRDGKITEFRKEMAWELLNKQVFFSERRSAKRPTGIHI